MHGWIRSTSKNHCPVCGGIKNCTWAEAPQQTIVWCGRVPGERTNAGGQHLHRIPRSGIPNYQPQNNFTPSESRLQESAIPDWGLQNCIAHQHSIAFSSPISQLIRRDLAESLGVRVSILEQMQVGHAGRSAAAIPERDAHGEIIGVQVRDIASGQKKQKTGSRRGLNYTENWADAHGPIVIVEGASDVAAGLSIGLCVIGRPSNRSDVGGQLSLLIAQAGQTDREVIVLGEHDKKPDGAWPGYEGAVKVARKLHAELPATRIIAALPPLGSKDLRDWKNDHPAGKSKDFLARLQEIEVHEPVPPPSLGTACSCDAGSPKECSCNDPAKSKQARRGHEPGCTCEHCDADIAQDSFLRKKTCRFTRAISDRERIRLIRVDCMSWSCLSCRKKLISQWTQHFLAISQTQDDATFYRHVCNKSTLAKVLRQLRESGGDYIRIKSSPNLFIVYSNRTSKQATSTSTLHAADAESLFYLDLLHSESGKRVVSTSRGWSQKQCSPKEDTLWRALEGNFNSPEAVKRACEIMGLRYWMREQQDQQAIFCEVNVRSTWLCNPEAVVDIFAALVTEITNSHKDPTEFESFSDWSDWKDSATTASSYPLDRETIESNLTPCCSGQPPDP